MLVLIKGLTGMELVTPNPMTALLTQFINNWTYRVGFQARVTIFTYSNTINFFIQIHFQGQYLLQTDLVVTLCTNDNKFSGLVTLCTDLECSEILG